MAQNNSGKDDAATQTADTNRSRQLNEQDPTYHRSRGQSEAQSKEQAKQVTQQNQQKKGQ